MMASSQLPKNVRRIEGSERHLPGNAHFVGPADPDERLTVTILVRPRPGAPPLPDLDYWDQTPPTERHFVSPQEFGSHYGAAAADLAQVAEFTREHGLRVEDTNEARRTVLATGTVKQVNEAFRVELGKYELDKHSFRGREGFVHVPEQLADVIEGVFGLDNRKIGGRNLADPPGTTLTSVPTIVDLYRFPKEKAHGETIGIVTLGSGYNPADLNAYFATLPPGYTAPNPIDVSVTPGFNNNPAFPDGETTQDICIASTVAQGATIAVYFTEQSQAGWVNLLLRAAFPNPGDPQPSVLSSSWYISNGDDAATLLTEGVSAAFVKAVHNAFRIAALRGITVFIASGDTGSNSKVADGKAHVQYPGSDPWVTSCGGTTVGAINGQHFDEYCWNDVSVFGANATGGGISDFFPQPHYQRDADVPVSVNDGHVGRGVPDIAANASVNSGYPMILGGAPFTANGTSASAPLYAGLMAVVNRVLHHRVGFFNPTLYRLHHRICRDITGLPGPTNNSLFGTPGYPCRPGWDACTGWGVIDGHRLLAALRGEENELEIAEGREFTGKVTGIIYDRFGDFDGFMLDTERGERVFISREQSVERLIRRAWADRALLTAVAHEPGHGHNHHTHGHPHHPHSHHEHHLPHNLVSIIVRTAVRPFEG